MKPRAVIIGGGMAGLATAHALARRGVRTTLVEQYELHHSRGSSHGSTRIFRLSYDEPHWIRMAVDALGSWRELERDCGRRLLDQSGSLEWGRDFHRQAAALRQCEVEAELLDAGSALSRERVALGEGITALRQADGGVALAHETLRAFEQLGRAAGAEILTGTIATGVTSTGERATVRIATGSLEADVAVVTAGGWAPGLLASAGISVPLSVTRETVAYFRAPRAWPGASLIDWRAPHEVGLSLRDVGESIYALRDPTFGLKVGVHRAGRETDPDDDGVVDSEAVKAMSAWVARHCPFADPEPVCADSCIYTSTPDESFALRRFDRIVVGSACSGHGFKFAPLVGNTLASLACELL